MLRGRKTKYILQIFDIVVNKILSGILSSCLNLQFLVTVAVKEIIFQEVAS